MLNKNLKKITKKFSMWLRDKRGSEVIEAVYTAAICCFTIISCIMILGYAVQSNNLAHAGKQIARAIEITGTAKTDQINTLVYELIPNANKIGVSWNVSPDGEWLSASEKKIQLRQKFSLVLTATYKIPVASVGSDAMELRLPIRIKINGQSEIYWKT